MRLSFAFGRPERQGTKPNTDFPRPVRRGGGSTNGFHPCTVIRRVCFLNTSQPSLAGASGWLFDYRGDFFPPPSPRSTGARGVMCLSCRRGQLGNTFQGVAGHFVVTG